MFLSIYDQVRKDELWTYLDKHKVMENHGLDEITYMHAKLRAIEASRKLLKTRINAGRLVVVNARSGGSNIKHNFNLKIFNLVHVSNFFFVGLKSLIVLNCWSNNTNQSPVASGSGFSSMH